MSDQDDPIIAHPTITPRNSLGSVALSYSSGSSISPSTSSSSGSQGSAKTAVSECLGAWLNYLQILNNLCAAGHRLAQTISTLEQFGTTEYLFTQQQTSPPPPPPSQPPVTPPPIAPPQHQQPPATLQHQINPNTQFITAWDDLAKATAVATSTVKSHIVSVLQDFVTQSLVTFDQESEQQRLREHNQQIIMETAQTMINLQHQFCVASYDSFSTLMCCFVCQAPMGYSHDPECSMIQQQSFPRSQNQPMGDPRSQTPSPHFGSLAMNFTRNDREMYRMPNTDSRPALFGSGSTQGSSEHNCAQTSAGTGIVMDSTRGPSPHHDIRGPSPIQGFLDNVRGPLPNPGHLLGMKAPFYRGSRSPLNFPLFPLNGQRRWSEAAAGEVRNELILDVESQMRRWSMPWEASKCDKNTVSWHQTRIMPISKLAVPISKGTSNERSQSITPDSIWQTSVTSTDGLAEAIQLLSCRPNRIFQQQQQQQQQQALPLGPPFIEEPHTSTNVGATYEMWSNRTQERLPFIKFPREQYKDRTSIDENH